MPNRLGVKNVFLTRFTKLLSTHVHCNRTQYSNLAINTAFVTLTMVYNGDFTTQYMSESVFKGIV